jgi:hypothetical protein
MARHLGHGQEIVLAEGEIVGKQPATCLLAQLGHHGPAILGAVDHALDRLAAVAALGHEDLHRMTSPVQRDDRRRCNHTR